MNDYITKPFRPEQLFATLARWLPAGLAPARLAKPALQVQLGLQHCMGREPLYRQLLKVFLETHGRDAAALQQALAAQDATALLQLVHNSISTAAILGAETLADQARRLQTLLLAREQQAQWPALVDEFVRLHALTLTDIRNYLESPPQAGA